MTCRVAFTADLDVNRYHLICHLCCWPDTQQTILMFHCETLIAAPQGQSDYINYVKLSNGAVQKEKYVSSLSY